MNSRAISEMQEHLTEQPTAVPDSGSGITARQRRLQRTNAAVFLVSLNAPCTPDELSSISWEALEAVPHWCFLTPDARRYLQLLCGALFIAPSMVRWIDGERIQAVCRLIGHQAYTQIIASVSHQIETMEAMDTDVESMLLQCGGNVLLGSVAHPGVQVLLRGLFDTGEPPLDGVTATQVYQQALPLYDQAMSHAVAEAAAERAASESASNNSVEAT